MTEYLRVYEDVFNELGALAVVDVHTHLQWARDRRADLADVLLYHFFWHELRACGMPDLRGRGPRDRVRAALPYLDRARNTGTYRALQVLLKDLFAMEEPFLCETNWEDIFERFEAKHQDRDWRRHVLADRAGIKSSAIDHDQYRRWRRDGTDAPHGARAPVELFFPTLEQSVFVSGTVRHIVEVLQRHCDVAVTDVATLEQAIQSFLSPKVLETIHAYLAWAPVSMRWEEVDRGRVDKILRRALSGESLKQEDLNAVHVHCLRVLLDALRGRGIVLQLFLGSETSAAGRKPNIAAHSPDVLGSLMDLFLEHPDQRFELLIGTAAFSQQANTLAKMLPNVGLSGIWWHSMYPSYIRRIIDERLDCVPMWKVCGFFSDAYNVEWSYAKWQLVRRELASAFSDRIARGRMSREDAREIARHWLWENPARVYGIDVRDAS